jgi:hypothetical protein
MELWVRGNDFVSNLIFLMKEDSFRMNCKGNENRKRTRKPFQARICYSLIFLILLLCYLNLAL